MTLDTILILDDVPMHQVEKCLVAHTIEVILIFVKFVRNATHILVVVFSVRYLHNEVTLLVAACL